MQAVPPCASIGITPVFAAVFTGCSLCVCAFTWPPSCKGTSHNGWSDLSTPEWPHFNLTLHLQCSNFQIKLQPGVLEVRTSTYVFGIHNSPKTDFRVKLKSPHLFQQQKMNASLYENIHTRFYPDEILFYMPWSPATTSSPVPYHLPFPPGELYWHLDVSVLLYASNYSEIPAPSLQAYFHNVIVHLWGEFCLFWCRILQLTLVNTVKAGILPPFPDSLWIPFI